MCGIAGHFGHAPESTLRRMVQTMSHRGPDGEGFLVTPLGGLGHCRLAIIDLVGGVQPMRSDTKKVSIAFNGEIYNYPSLRDELKRMGFFFHTQSDTEVILRGYEAWGEHVFARLDGMFAIAILDEDRAVLLLARDRAGEKPLYLHKTGGTVFFASELKALLQTMGKLRLDPSALGSYFFSDAARTPDSLILNVEKLRPGTYVRCTRGGREEVVYWQPRSILAGSLPSELVGESALLSYIDKLLADAVAARLLQADVPVGVFLSGGIDSSIITWYAVRASAQPVRTFSIRFEESSYDESGDAKMVARHLGTVHTEIDVSAADAQNMLPGLAGLVDEPIADPSIIPTHLLAKGARKDVTVALSGDGADELTLGYASFLAHRWHPLIRRMPGVGLALRGLSGVLQSRGGYMSPSSVIERFMRGYGVSDHIERDLRWRGTFSIESLGGVLSAPLRDAARRAWAADLNYWRNETQGLDPYGALTLLYFSQYLCDVVLPKVDRASMASSLEVRAPFLATDVIEFLLRVPSRYKLSYLSSKNILRKLMRGRLPPPILQKPKHGLSLPIADWFRTAWRPLLLDLLEPGALEQTGLYEVKEVMRLRDDHLHGRVDRRKELWALVVFELWRRAHGVTL